MNWDAIGAVGELAGGIVVLITIVYLSRQVRESNKFARADAEREVQAQWTGITDALLRDEALRAVLRKGNDSFDSLSGNEKASFSLYLTHVMNQLELVLNMEQRSLLSEQIADTYRNIAGQIMSTRGAIEYWEIGKNLNGELSTTYINAYHAKNGQAVTDTLPFWSEEKEA